jgi:hypothetical protein
MSQEARERYEARLKGLRAEYEAVKGFQYMSFNCLDACKEWYEHEIECCERTLKGLRENGKF